MKLVEPDQKRTETLYAGPICPIRVGKPAVLTRGGRLFHTSRVVALHELTPEYIHFETKNTHYHISMNPFGFAATSPLPVSLAA